MWGDVPLSIIYNKEKLEETQITNTHTHTHTDPIVWILWVTQSKIILKYKFTEWQNYTSEEYSTVSHMQILKA